MPWHVILHGGCTESCPDINRQQEIKRSLQIIAETAAEAINEGVYAKDVVVQAVSALENCPLFNAGVGSALTEDGMHELEAGLVDGTTGLYGAVGCVTTAKNPILAANALLEHGPHCMIVGRAADDMCKTIGLETVANEHFNTAFRRAHWEQSSPLGNKQASHDTGTVGAIVLDKHGNIAAGASTGGVTGKSRGRIGDTAVLGAGLYACPRMGVVCSGAGDQIFRQLVASKVANYHSSGFDLAGAVRRAVIEMSRSGKPCAVAAMDAAGNISVENTARIFYTASGSFEERPHASLYSTTLPIYYQHVFYNDNRLTAGLTRYPTTRGHTVAILKRPEGDLFSLKSGDFAEVMRGVQKVAIAVRAFYRVGRCALVTEGGSSLTILPLHDLNSAWEPVTSDVREFHEAYPGYISSTDGPHMSHARLDDLCAKIRKVSGLSPPCDLSFEGDLSDDNLFARIIRGELPEWRIWEDDKHVAFLTPFANSPGFTVVVPRSHQPSDIFSLDNDAYAKMVCAAQAVARILKIAFGVDRCGMIFEGFEIDYAHAKLIPIREAGGKNGASSADAPLRVSPFQDSYEGYVTSLSGPLTKDVDLLTGDAISISKSFSEAQVQAPKSWQSAPTHASAVITDAWYTKLFDVQDALFHASVDFFKRHLGYKYCLVPATTDAISSPMGLGSDSEPVPISLLGQTTHLADSMQFALEYFLRIEDGLPGVYYINTSFRGEDADSMHLNQFYHVECELRGNFGAGITVAEKYIVHLTSTFLQDHETSIRASAGGTDHLTALLQHYQSHGNQFPQVTLENALDLPGMDSKTWKFVVPSDPGKGRTVTRVGELKLIEHFGGAVWLTEMDHLGVPFYQAYTNETQSKARCADLLLGGGEVLGLGERHMLVKDVLAALLQHEVPVEPYVWYTDMRETKQARTTGWGMGVERFLGWVFQHHDIRDLTIIPRMKGYTFAP